MGVGYRSNGSGEKGTGISGALPPATRLAAARGENPPDLAKTGAPGSIRPGFGSGAIYTAGVIHLCAQVGETELGMACAVAVVGLRGGARRRTCVREMPGSVWGANGTASTFEVWHIYWGSL